jgi:hypothetical protein
LCVCVCVCRRGDDAGTTGWQSKGCSHIRLAKANGRPSRAQQSLDASSRACGQTLTRTLDCWTRLCSRIHCCSGIACCNQLTHGDPRPQGISTTKALSVPRLHVHPYEHEAARTVDGARHHAPTIAHRTCATEVATSPPTHRWQRSRRGADHRNARLLRCGCGLVAEGVRECVPDRKHPGKHQGDAPHGQVQAGRHREQYLGSRQGGGGCRDNEELKETSTLSAFMA